MRRLTLVEKDALEEVASIGGGNASAALSNLVGEIVNLKISTVDIAPIKEIQELIGGPKKLIVGVYSTIKGDVKGNVITILEKKNALFLVDILQRKTLGTTKILGKQEQKLIKETGKTLLTFYLNAFSDFLKIKTIQTKPKFVSTFGESIMDFVLIGIHEKLEHLLLFKTDFGVEKRFEGNFILLLAIESIDILLKAIKKKLE